jgi:DNA-binding MarR family transcriptional regulator
MPTCFVIQPFDGSKFDKRFDDVYSPAIHAAGLEPYRVDRDPKAHIPIDAIEDGIRTAVVVLADITLNNPNVWYELGYAFAAGTPVVMICSKEREGGRYPFDIQHRAIISYSSESLSDFTQLRDNITQHLKAAVTRGEQMRRMSESETIAPQKGLSQAELFVLSGIAGSTTPTSAGCYVSRVQDDVERMGLTPIGCSLGLRRLSSKNLIVVLPNPEDDSYPELVKLTEMGWDWIDENEDLFMTRRETEVIQQRKSLEAW